MSRRRFLAVAAATAALSACGDGEVSGIGQVIDVGGSGTNAPSNKITVTVSNVAGLSTTGALVQLPNTFVAAKRTGPTTFDAYYMACTHAGCLTDIVSNRFDCPCHGSQFNSDGDVITGPASTPLKKLPAVYDQATDVLTIN